MLRNEFCLLTEGLIGNHLRCHCYSTGAECCKEKKCEHYGVQSCDTHRDLHGNHMCHLYKDELKSLRDSKGKPLYEKDIDDSDPNRKRKIEIDDNGETSDEGGRGKHRRRRRRRNLRESSEERSRSRNDDRRYRQQESRDRHQREFRQRGQHRDRRDKMSRSRDRRRDDRHRYDRHHRDRSQSDDRHHQSRSRRHTRSQDGSLMGNSDSLSTWSRSRGSDSRSRGSQSVTRGSGSYSDSRSWNSRSKYSRSGESRLNADPSRSRGTSQESSHSRDRASKHSKSKMRDNRANRSRASRDPEFSQAESWEFRTEMGDSIYDSRDERSQDGSRRKYGKTGDVIRSVNQSVGQPSVKPESRAGYGYTKPPTAPAYRRVEAAPRRRRREPVPRRKTSGTVVRRQNHQSLGNRQGSVRMETPPGQVGAPPVARDDEVPNKQNARQPLVAQRGNYYYQSTIQMPQGRGDDVSEARSIARTKQQSSAGSGTRIEYSSVAPQSEIPSSMGRSQGTRSMVTSQRTSVMPQSHMDDDDSEDYEKSSMMDESQDKSEFQSTRA